MAGIPFYTLRQRVGRLMGAMVTGTPSGTYTTTGMDTTELPVYVDDYFNDWHGRFYAGPNRNTNFEVTDFAKSSGHLTFSPAATTVVAQDLFELHMDFTPLEMNDMINLAISRVEEEALQDIVDETIQVKDDIYEYTIPTNIYSIDRIYEESSTADRYSASDDLIDVRHWRVLRGSPAKIWFNNDYVSLTADRNLRIVGQAKQAQLSEDDDTCDINQMFIVYQAKALLHESRIRGEGSGFAGHTTQAQLAQARADEERSRLSVALRGHRV